MRDNLCNSPRFHSEVWEEVREVQTPSMSLNPPLIVLRLGNNDF